MDSGLVSCSLLKLTATVCSAGVPPGVHELGARLGGRYKPFVIDNTKITLYVIMRPVLFSLLVMSLFVGCGRPEYPSGEAIFQGECVRCRKLNGSGGTKGPDLTTIFSRKDEELV